MLRGAGNFLQLDDQIKWEVFQKNEVLGAIFLTFYNFFTKWDPYVSLLNLLAASWVSLVSF